MLVNRRTLRIEWGQCDPAGIVFYPQYLIIFDTSTGWLFERTGLTPSAMRKKYQIVGMPIVARAGCSGGVVAISRSLLRPPGPGR